MQRLLRTLAAGLFGVALFPASLVAPAAAQGTPAAIVVGVDHVDLANQNPNQNRAFEYRDFFTRSVTVHTGDVIDFQTAPGGVHLIGLAPSDAAGRAAYPIAFLDPQDSRPATGTGLPKIALGPGNLSVTGGSTKGGGTISQNPNGPPVCGVQALGQSLCNFSGGNDVEIAGLFPAFDPKTGNPAPADWKIKISAPAGTYSYLCWIHPGMTGTVTVVDASQPATTQAQIDAQSPAQFAADQAAALAAEKAANVPQYTGGAAGSRTYQVSVGVGGAHYGVLEMLPQHLSLAPGDQIQYVWKDPNEVHTVGFPAGDQRLPSPFGFNCGTSFQSPPSGNGPSAPPCLLPGAKQPDFIADPGNAPSGTVLTDPKALVDSGILVGPGYGVTPTSQQWSIKTNGTSAAGTYSYQCTVHDFMVGTIAVAAVAAPAAPTTAPAAPVAQAPAQIPAHMPSTGGGGSTPLWGVLVCLGLLVSGVAAVRLRRS